MLEIGSVIGGKYRILHQIGKGGMSNVYLALNEKANKQWAVKEVRKTGGRKGEIIRQTLVAETDILRHLRHPNLPSIVDIIQTEDTYLILMDYIEGVTLMQKLDEEGAQGQEDVVRWAIQVCDVLEYLHTRKPPIIYRDTKPANIMLKPDGDVVLIDFGTARKYEESKEGDTQWLGTKGYAAPEQFGGSGQTDARTDIYNLGATMYHLLTGHNPSRYPYEMYPVRKWDESLSSGLEDIILKCTRKNPEERYQSCSELMYALEHYREMEEGYVRQQKKHLCIFIACCVASAACFGGAVFAGVKADSLTADHYSTYIREAESATTQEGMLEGYRKAIAVSPSNGQAYDEILERVFLEDGVFSKEEADRMSEILGSVPDGSRLPAERLLKADKAAYEDFAYRMGIAYFYYYEGEGNKPMSQPWFGIAKEGESIDEARRVRAERFWRIAEYYVALGARDKAGDNTVSYAQYWDDMEALTAGNLVAEDNEKTAIVMYRELLYQVTMHTNDFRKGGISEERMRASLENIRERTASDFDETQMAENDRESLRGLLATLDAAGRAVDTAFRGAVEDMSGGGHITDSVPEEEEGTDG